MITRPMPGWSFKVARSTEINTSICPVRRSWALKLLPDTRPAYGSYLSQSISLVASLNTPEKVSSVRLMNGPSASRTNLLVEALWMWGSRLRNDASGCAMNSCRALSVRLLSYSGEKTIWPRTPVRSCSDESSKNRLVSDMIGGLGREPAHDGGHVLLRRRRARADPVEDVEAELGM